MLASALFAQARQGVLRSSARAGREDTRGAGARAGTRARAGAGLADTTAGINNTVNNSGGSSARARAGAGAGAGVVAVVAGAAAAAAVTLACLPLVN